MTVLVIGAAGTIGKACVTALQAMGLGDLVAVDLSAPSITGVESRSLDVTKVEQVGELIRELDARSPITGVIYAAGLNTTGEVDTIDWVDYERVMAVNLRGAFHVAAALMEVLRKKPRSLGTVFISSTAGLRGEAGGSIYCASKFGLIGFATSFAGEIAKFGGRANVVCPGNVDSPMLSKLAATIGEREGISGESMLDRWRNSSAFRRLIEPREVGETCAWLVSSQSSGVSGQVIVVDGPLA
jgi:NAD(P)-dependent dehydrogenase (short-subunit alcohol dehydrogenase family)